MPVSQSKDDQTIAAAAAAGAPSPSRTVTISMSAAQLAYVRYLLFKDLREEGEAIVQEAHSAHEFGGPSAGYDAQSSVDVMDVTTSILDLIGWDTAGDNAALKWMEREMRREDR